MKFQHRDQSNIDPFNAGDPVMPWDDPRARHDSATDCELTEHSYQAPTKAKSTRGSSSSRKSSSKTSEKNGSSQQSAPASSPFMSALFGDGGPVSESGTGSSASSDSAASSSSDSSASNGSSTPTFATSKKVTVSRTKRARRSSAGRLGKPRNRFKLLIIIVLAIIFVPSIIGMGIDLVGDVVSDFFEDDSSYSSSYSSTSSTSTYDEEGEQELTEILQAKLDEATADTEAMDARFIKVLDKRLESNLGYTSSEMGLDTATFCAWMRDRTTFELSGVYCYTDSANIYFDSKYPALYELDNAFGDKAYRYLSKQGIRTYYSDASKKPALSDAQKSRLNTFFCKALDKTTKQTSGSASISVEPEDGTWDIDDEDFETALLNLLGSY